MRNYLQGLISTACMLLGVTIALAQAPSKELTYEKAKAMDMDKDGRITLAEFLSASSDLALFEKIDADENSVLDAGEIRKAVRPPYKVHN